MFRSIKAWGYVLLSTFVFVGTMPSLGQACSVCWGGDDAFTQAMNASILFLMAMPFVIGGGIMGVLFMAQRRARGQRWSTGVTKPLA